MESPSIEPTPTNKPVRIPFSCRLAPRYRFPFLCQILLVGWDSPRSDRCAALNSRDSPRSDRRAAWCSRDLQLSQIERACSPGSHPVHVGDLECCVEDGCRYSRRRFPDLSRCSDGCSAGLSRCFRGSLTLFRRMFRGCITLVRQAAPVVLHGLRCCGKG